MSSPPSYKRYQVKYASYVQDAEWYRLHPNDVLALPNPNLVRYRLVSARDSASLLTRALHTRRSRTQGDLPRARRRLSKSTGSRGSGVLAKRWVGQFRYEFIHHGLN